jgi:uncharacterized phage protein (TIGR02218 family)
MATITDGPVTSLAFCWQLERRDGAGVSLTSHDARIERGGVIYTPAPGMTPAAIVRRRGLEPQSSEVDGALSDAALTDEDMELGRWDGARVILEAIDWVDTDHEGIRLLDGEIGSVGVSDRGFTAELVGAAAKLDAPACPETSSECRAVFGDRHCRVDQSGRRTTAVVVAHNGTRLAVEPAPLQEVACGQLAVVSGPMTGFRSPILAVDNGGIILRDPPRGKVATGSRVWLVEGCDKRFATCRDRFDNAVNFRGEPHLPGNDLLTRYPGA